MLQNDRGFILNTLLRILIKSHIFEAGTISLFQSFNFLVLGILTTIEQNTYG